MRELIHEEARDIRVLERADVLVAGGGLSGFAAALSAARLGAKTVLVERNGCLGGVATASLMANIGNRYILSSGEQTVYGIAAEVVERLVTLGGAKPNWRAHKAIAIDSERLKVILVEMLEEAGVMALTHSFAARPIMDGPAVRGCYFESKSGRQAVLAKNTIDATGEADLACQAGADLVEHRGNSSLLFKLARVDIDRFVDFLGEDPDGFPCNMDRVKDYDTLARDWREDGVFFFPHYGGTKWRYMQDCIAQGHFTPEIPPAVKLDVLGMYSIGRNGTVAVNSNYYIFETLDIRDLSRYELHAQRMCYYVADFLKEHVPGFEDSYVEHVGVDLGLRGARWIQGRSMLKTEHMYGPPGPVYFDDVIATTPAETKDGGKAGFLGHTCDLPFGAAVPRGTTHLLVGSAKSISTEGGGKRLIRGMSGCMIYGQATGAAAALAAGTSLAAEDVPIRELQQALLNQGVRLGDEERLSRLGLDSK